MNTKTQPGQEEHPMFSTKAVPKLIYHDENVAGVRIVPLPMDKGPSSRHIWNPRRQDIIWWLRELY